MKSYNGTSVNKFARVNGKVVIRGLHKNNWSIDKMTKRLESETSSDRA